MAAVDKDLASGEVVGSSTPFNLFAGDMPIITEPGILDTGALAKYTVVAKLSATGKLVALAGVAPDPVTGSHIAYGITTQPADATSADVTLGIYIGGFFNHAALVWPAEINTLALRQAAFDGTLIRIGSVLGA